MRAGTFTFQADDSKSLFVHRWLPDDEPRGIFHIAHGMAEHGGRYASLAEALTSVGWAVYANDHRGHGKTAVTSSELGFFAKEKGFERVTRDLDELIKHEQQQHPRVPVVLFGHSMGSYMVQDYVIQHGSLIQGAVLSGSSGKPDAVSSMGRYLARIERLRLGAKARSPALKAVTFDAFNRGFAPSRTAFDWLSRDAASVDKYLADPLCGFAVSTSLWVDVLRGMQMMSQPERQARIPKNLPIYIFSGARDAVSGNCKSLNQLLSAYRAAGLRNVKHRFYENARHEMLHETNREEVTRDLLAWLSAEIKQPAGADLKPTDKAASAGSSA